MTDDIDAAAVRQAETTAETLAAIAGRRPDLGAPIAEHPNAYEGLLDWLAEYGDPAARAAVAARRQAPSAVPEEMAPSSAPAEGVAATHGDLPPAYRTDDPAGTEHRTASPPKLSRPALIALVTAAVVVVVVMAIVIGNGIAGTPAAAPVHDQGQATITAAPPQEPSPSPSQPDVAPSAPPPAPPVGQWTFATSSGYGYTMQLTMLPPTTSGTNGSRSDHHGSTNPGEWSSTPNTIGSICTDFDPNVDVAIPVEMTLTATTSGFDTPLSANILINRRSGGGSGNPPAELGNVAIESEDFYSSGSTCAQWDGTGTNAGVNWDDPVKTGTSSTWNFTVILKNYRSPNAPSGDPALLDWITVQPASSTSTNTAVGTYAQQSGPSAVTLTGQSVN